MEFQHGGDIYRNKIEYDFSANINPLDMPVGCMAAIQKAISHIREYPDYYGKSLCQEIAGTESVKCNQVILGNGAAELIYTLCYAIKPRKALEMVPTFSEYENAVAAAGGIMQFWNLEEQQEFMLKDYLLQTNSFLDSIKEDTDILFLCNPNNPTGAVIEKKQLLRIAGKCEEMGTYFCIDECFLPFLEEEDMCTMKHELERFPHLLVLRAFTKVYAMPGLRLGYALSANLELLERMQRCLPPWNTSVIAQAAGIEALKDKEFLGQTRKFIREEKRYLLQELQCGLTDQIYASKANFIFFKSREDLKERLLEKGILIRSCNNYRNLSDGYFRIAVRTHEENKELIRRWQMI